ncbi:MAG: hypothetical protein AXA67_05650 [Methylothermaceae bacteria B42]|nr:MAG: hypothetical protein AXA67_05650 [Methylothermaceae bacteria B42]HHJ40337.1 TIGR02099 family protein [Methylothermaceae bacterium]
MQLFHHTLRFTRLTLFIFLVLLALAITLLRAWILPSIDRTRHHWEKKLSQELGIPLQIQKLRAHLHGWTPELRLIGISIGPTDKQTRLFDEVQVAIDLPGSVLTGSLTPSLIRILGARLEIQKTKDGDFRIKGLGETQGNSDLTFGDGRFELLHSEITLYNPGKNTLSIPFRDVSLRLDNQGRHHRLQVFLIPPGQNTGKIHLDTEFEGKLTNPAAWRGHFYLDLQTLQLHPIQQFIRKTDLISQDEYPWLPSVLEHFSCQRGEGNLSVWGDWEPRHLSQLQGQLQLNGLAVGRRNPPVTLAKIQTWFRWRHSDQQYSLELTDFTIYPELNHKATHLSLSLDYSSPAHTLKLAIKNLDLDELQAPLHLILSAPGLSNMAQLRGYTLSGGLRNFSLEWHRQPKSTHHLAACGELRQISFIGPNQSWPQVKNVSANLCGNLKEGQLHLQTHQATLAFPALLRKPVSLDKAVGLITWQKNKPGWRFHSPHLRLANPDLDATLKLGLVWERRQPFKPTVEGMAIISRLHMKAIKHYLPKQIPHDLAAWFNRSPLRGDARGKVLIRGNLSRFPFRDKSGINEAVLTTHNLTIDFLRDWPAVTHANGVLSLNNDHLVIQLDQSQFAGAKIGRLRGEIQAIGLSPTFDIHGTTSNQAKEVFHVLRQSPLQEPVNTLLQWCDIQGSAYLDLSLAIPLKKTIPFHLSGKATIKKARMAMKPYPLKLEKLSGNLNFTEKDMRSYLKGRFSGQPAKLTIVTQARNTHAQFDTRIDSPWLSRQFFPKITEIAEGSTAVTASLDIDHNDAIPPRLGFRSNLEGMQIKLPAPLAKPKDQSRLLLLTSWLDAATPHPLNLDYGNIHANLMLDEHLTPVSGRIGIGQPPPTPKNGGKGFTIEGSLPKLSLDDWQSFFGSWTLNNKQASFLSITLETDHLWNWHRDWGKVAFQGLSRNGIWQGTVGTSFTQGKWSYFSKQNALNGQLDFLDLTPLVSLSASSPSDKSRFSLEKLPRLNLYTHRLLWEKRDLGPLNLEAASEQGKIDFTLHADADTHQLHAEGWWSLIPEQTHTKGRLRSKNLGKFLKRIGHTTPIAETPAKIDFDLRWPGAPYQFALNALDGKVKFKLGRGRLLDIEPGAGRLLGILYLGTLQRRLRLDFSDLFQSGLAYDRITGAMTLADGRAVTDNLLIESVPARIFVTGEVDLSKKEVNEFVTVIPNTPLTLGLFKYRQNSGIGKAAGIAQKTFNAPLDSLTQSQYAINGTWDDPVITRVRRSLPGTLLHGIWKGLSEITGKNRK